MTNRGTNLVPERPRTGSASNDGRRPEVDDRELVRRVKSGQTQAYGELIRRYQDRVFNACWRICGHLEDARDLTQDAFLKAFENLDAFRQESGFYTWVFRVAVNLALSHKRTAARRRTVSLDGDPRTAGTHAGGTQAAGLLPPVERSHEESPSRRVDEAEIQGELVRALSALDDEHRAVVVLRDIEGFDYREIGAILELPTGTVKSRLHRARAALRDAVAPLLDPKPRSG